MYTRPVNGHRRNGYIKYCNDHIKEAENMNRQYRLWLRKFTEVCDESRKVVEYLQKFSFVNHIPRFIPFL